MNQIAVRYHEFGDPIEVLKLEELPKPKVGAGEVLIQMKAAAIHPSDFGLINGSYGNLKALPATAGREGVGEVVEIGSEVDEKVIGKLAAVPEGQGVWQEFSTCKTDDLILLPSLVPVDQLAVSMLNPLTAWRLLHDFEYLNEGDLVIQNAGNSAVGMSVIQIAKSLGLRCISLVRTEERLKDLENLGVESVWLDNDEVPVRVEELTSGEKCKLALNSIGGRSSLRLAKSLCQGGVHVTFGAMDGSPMRFPTRELIFQDIRLVGFWLDRWKRKQTPAGIRNALEKVLEPLALNHLKYPIDRVFDLKNYVDALKRNGASRMGKVLMSPDPKQIEIEEIKSF